MARPKRGKCKTAKRRFGDEITAKLEIARFQRIDDPNRLKLPIRAYHCKPCKGWHLTSQEERQAAPMAAAA